MFNCINKVIIVGYVGIDPEIKYMSNGNSISVITVGTSLNYKDKNTGNYVKKTDWHKITLYNRFAEISFDFLKKGSKVYLEGSLKTSKYVYDGGVSKHFPEIVADNIQILDFDRKNVFYRADNYNTSNFNGNDDISF